MDAPGSFLPVDTLSKYIVAGVTVFFLFDMVFYSLMHHRQAKRTAKPPKINQASGVGSSVSSSASAASSLGSENCVQHSSGSVQDESPHPSFVKGPIPVDKWWGKGDLTEGRLLWLGKNFAAGLTFSVYGSISPDVRAYCEPFGVKEEEFLIIQNKGRFAVIIHPTKDYHAIYVAPQEASLTYEQLESALLAKGWRAYERRR